MLPALEEKVLISLMFDVGCLLDHPFCYLNHGPPRKEKKFVIAIQILFVRYMFIVVLLQHKEQYSYGLNTKQILPSIS